MCKNCKINPRAGIFAECPLAEESVKSIQRHRKKRVRVVEEGRTCGPIVGIDSIHPLPSAIVAEAGASYRISIFRYCSYQTNVTLTEYIGLQLLD
jgi:hypothetical protein